MDPHKDIYDDMHVLGLDAGLHIAHLECDLIAYFKGDPKCRNQRDGGDGPIERREGYFVYVCRSFLKPQGLLMCS